MIKVHVPDPKTHYENVVGVQSWKSKKELESLREEPKKIATTAKKRPKYQI